MSAPQTEIVKKPLESGGAEASGGRAVSRRDTCVRWLDNAVFLATAVLVLAIPHPTIIVYYAFRAIWLLWAVRLLLGKNNLRVRPLYLPIVIFVGLAFMATVHSYEPLLSWNRVEKYAELLVVIPIAENLRSVRRMKWLIALLLASSMVSALRTGWQYWHGIGTRLVAVAPKSQLGKGGVLSDDIVQEINGHPTRTPKQWQKALEETRNDAQLHLRLARAWPYYERVDRVIPRAAFDEWLAWPGAKVAPGRPVRAQGHFYHYVPYAGLMMELGLIAFGLLLTTPKARWRLRALLAVVFMALLTCLVATVSRAHLGALLVGCLVVFCIQARGRWRMAAVGVFIVALVVGSLWLRKERGVSWYSSGDVSIEYRLLMWRDSVRLIREHPLLGIGPDSELGDNLRWNLEAYRRYPLIGHFHSSPIEVAVTCGLPALAVGVWLLAEYFSLLLRLLKKMGGRGSSVAPALSHASVVAPAPFDCFPRGLVLGFFGGAIALVISSFVHFITGDAEVMILVWFSMGVTVALGKICQDHEVGAIRD